MLFFETQCRYLIQLIIADEQGSKWEKISADMVALPFSLPPFKLALFCPTIDANISNQLPKCQKSAYKAYQYVFYQNRSADMLSRWPRKCRYAGMPYQSLPSHFKHC